MTPFTHAILDFNNEIIRKVRWSNREAKWFRINHPSFTIVKLDRPKEIDVKELVGEALF